MTREPLVLLRRSGRKVEVCKVAVHQTEQRLKFFGLSAVRCSREHDEVLFIFRRDTAHEVVTLLLPRTRSAGARASVGFVQNHQFRALADEYVAARIALDVINAQHLKWEMLEHAGVAMNFPVEPRLCI